MGLCENLLSFKIPEVKTSGNNIGHPYGTVQKYLPVNKSSEQPACRAGE
jgi:hypothetical protein